MSPLDGAWLRVRRADMHVSEARRLIHSYGQNCKDHIIADNHSDPERPTFSLNAPALPVDLPVIISDAIHNLRSALDYIVFELARKDSGKIQDGTQFLIEDFKRDAKYPKRGFDAKTKNYLKGISGRHIAMIESFQPYQEVNWTKTLRDISNPDKHRELTGINKEGTFVSTYNGGIDLAAQKPLIIDPNDWDVDATYALYVSPAILSEPSLMPTLYNIQSGVRQVLELFNGEF